MKLRGPIHSIDARGRFADALVFGIWRGLNWARKFVMPTQPKTQRQIRWRDIVATVARTWGTLTQDQRNSWEAYAGYNSPVDAQTGNAVRLTGFDSFLSVNTVLVDTDQTLAAIPPALPLPGQIPGYAVAPGAVAGQVVVTWTPLPAGVVVDFFTQDVPASRHLYPFKYKHNQYLDGVLGTLTFSGLTTGHLFGVQGRQIRADGGRGPFTMGQAIVPGP
jgi:hypothetical protein